MARARLYAGKIARLFKELWSLFFMVSFRTFLRYVVAILMSIPAIVRKRGLLPASQKMRGRKYAFRVFGQSVTLDGKYWGRATELYARGVYFLLPEFRLSKDMIVVDLGANIGAFTILAARLAKRVVAVEAVYGFFQELKENIYENHVENDVEAVWAIVGPGSGMLHDPEIFKNMCGDKIPPRISLQKLFDEHGIKKVDFMKVDIEGSEYDLFERDTEWLSKVGHIAMEVHPQYGDISKLRMHIEQERFKVQLVSLNGKAVSAIKDQAGYLFAKNLKFQHN